MDSRLVILLLLQNLIICGFVAAYQNVSPIDNLGERHEAKYHLAQPINDLDVEQISEQQKFKSELENWTGKWMPDNNAEPTSSPVINNHANDNKIHDFVSMNDIPPHCDDGKTNLSNDWDNSLVDYTCFRQKIMPSYEINPEWICEYVPVFYKAAHYCMNRTIEYDVDIPLYGNHRPVWPVYGEYNFLPPQRWLHSLEHGAIVMLYHPCANSLEIERLKDLLTKCLRRHVITRNKLLDLDRPLALLSWGCQLTMSYVDNDLVARFIRQKALHGPENIAADGKFSEGLLTPAQIVSDKDDSTLCPHLQ